MSSLVLKNELIYAIIDKIVDKYQRDSNNLLQILLDVQGINRNNYIPKDTGMYVCEKLDIQPVKLNNVISHHEELSSTSRGRYVINLCNGSTCNTNNCQSLKKILIEELKINMGETSKDNLFTLNEVSCIGECNSSPAVKINNKIYGNLNNEKITELINKLRN